MATPRQIAANRLNANNSTGPRSVQGKSRSRHNALTHGLTAQQTLLPNEDPAAFNALRQAILTEFAPDGALECQLVEHAASSAWRLRRVPTIEVALIEWVNEKQGRDYDYDDSRSSQALEPIRGEFMGRGSSASREVLQVGRAFQTLFDTNLTGKLGRYETHLQRQLSATLKELREAQAHRPDLPKLIDAAAENLEAETATLSDQEAVTGRISRIRRTRPAPVDFDHGVEEGAGRSLEDFAGMLGVD